MSRRNKSEVIEVKCSACDRPTRDYQLTLIWAEIDGKKVNTLAFICYSCAREGCSIPQDKLFPKPEDVNAGD